MKHTSIRKPLSVLLSILMALSVFGGMAFPAGAESKTIAEGVIYKLGDTIVLPGNGNYYVKADEYGSPRKVYGNGTISKFEGDEYSYRLKIDGWGIYTYIDMFEYQEKLNQGLSVLGITFTGSGTESNPYLLEPALGVVESTWAGEGEGTEASPWLIKDLNDLRTLSANVASGMTYSGKYLKLAADIDCGSDNWEAIGGANAKMFRGTFDGDSHTITYNVAISGDEDNKGLFYGVGAGGTVKNLNVAGSINSTNMSAGYFGGVAVFNAGTITNCYSAMDITTAGEFSGGIAGMNEGGATISYCAASGTITWTGGSNSYAYIAGITAENFNEFVNNCAMLGDVLAQNAKDHYNYAGRLIGRQYNASSSHDCYYLDTMTVTGVVNSDSVTAKTADELKEIGQAAYDAGYTVYGLALGAVAPNPDQEAADAVIALIDAIGEVVLTDECKQKIDAAKAAYEALTDAQKALVGNYETLQLAEGQYTALQLAADMTAFEAYKTAKKSAMDALRQEGDSEAVQSIVGLAKTQIEGFTYDESKTLDENKAALDTLVANVPNAVAEQRAADNLAADKAAFDDYKAEKKAAVEALAEEGDSTDAQQIIADAAAAIEALTYDEAKTLDENKAAADEIADIADDLAEQRAADKAAADQAAADEVAALIDAIGEVEYNDESKGKIDAARAAYDALTDDQKALVENDDVLTAAEAKYDELKAVAETPDDPEEPVTPTDPDTPAEERVCPICGNTHNKGTLDRLVGVIHRLIALFHSLFTLPSRVC